MLISGFIVNIIFGHNLAIWGVRGVDPLEPPWWAGLGWPPGLIPQKLDFFTYTGHLKGCSKVL